VKRQRTQMTCQMTGKSTVAFFSNCDCDTWLVYNCNTFMKMQDEGLQVFQVLLSLLFLQTSLGCRILHK